jgi:hypothetical protein
MRAGLETRNLHTSFPRILEFNRITINLEDEDTTEPEIEIKRPVSDSASAPGQSSMNSAVKLSTDVTLPIGRGKISTKCEDPALVDSAEEPIKIEESAIRPPPKKTKKEPAIIDLTED